MSDRAKGDAAVADVEAKLTKIAEMKKSFGGKIKLMEKVLRAATTPWNLAGDDRVLSGMRIAAGVVVERATKLAVDSIKSSRKSADEKERALAMLRTEIEGIGWLADGFKSSIRAETAFAMAEIRMKSHQ